VGVIAVYERAIDVENDTFEQKATSGSSEWTRLS
jgi:hypothetical protein